MSYLGKIGNTISSKSKEIASKAKAISETSSLNSMIKAEQNKIDANFKLMGKLYYEKFGSSPDEEFAEAVSAINTSNREIENINEQIKKIKSRNCCPNCGASFKNDAVFCSKCGEKVKAEEEKTEEIKCIQCGNILEADAAFCDSCGTKVADAKVLSENTETVVVQIQLPDEKTESTEILEPVVDNKPTEENAETAEPVVLNEKPVEEKKDTLNGVCPSCGEKSDDPDANFCNSCGTKLK